MMEAFYAVLLAIGAFWLGACPFSVWVGRWLLSKNILRYGDGNPGAANVFRAGDVKTGLFALSLDMAKGAPFVLAANLLFGLPTPIVLAIGLSAILGHAFSPVLGFKGGKSVAVTFGVLIALLQPEVLFSCAVFMLLGFLFIEQNAWTSMVGPTGSLAYLFITRGNSWETLFMLCVLTLFTAKQYEGLRTAPRFRVKLINWLQSRRRET
jgi:glycerol-3-phosphate acyltransferase PlsY